MNRILEMLRGGDLRSDGKADEAADEVLGDPSLFPLLAEGLGVTDDVVRGRAAHALEKVSRMRPELLDGLLDSITEGALGDEVPMVRWHLTMILGNLDLSPGETDGAIDKLLRLLGDGSVFVRSWAIVILTILGTRDSTRRKEITMEIRALRDDESVAIRSKVSNALAALEDGKPIPKGWIKRE